MREYANIGKWGCRSQKNPVEMMSSNTQITLAEFLTLLPAAQTLCSSPAKPCCPGCPAPALPQNLLSPLPTAAQGILCLIFPPDWTGLPSSCSIPCSGCSHHTPAPFPVPRNVLSLFWFTFPFSQFTKHPAKLNINLLPAPSPEKCHPALILPW